MRQISSGMPVARVTRRRRHHLYLRLRRRGPAHQQHRPRRHRDPRLRPGRAPDPGGHHPGDRPTRADPGQYDLTYDNVGNPTKVIGNRAGTTRTDTYTYDAANRVTGLCYATTTCTGATQSITYAYNLVGDRTSEIRTGVSTPGTITSTYDAADQLTSTTGAVTASYTYDRDGNALAHRIAVQRP